MSCQCPNCNSEDERPCLYDQIAAIKKKEYILRSSNANLEESIRTIGEENNELTKENARLREALKKLEWCVPDILGRKQCPACHWNKVGVGIGNEQVRGHKPDCWLAKALEGK